MVTVEEYIKKAYYKATGKNAIIRRDSIGAIDYFLKELWVTSVEDSSALIDTIYKAIQEFPEEDYNLVYNIYMDINVHDSAYHAFLAGYFTQVVDSRNRDNEDLLALEFFDEEIGDYET